MTPRTKDPFWIQLQQSPSSKLGSSLPKKKNQRKKNRLWSQQPKLRKRRGKPSVNRLGRMPSIDLNRLRNQKWRKVILLMNIMSPIYLKSSCRIYRKIRGIKVNQSLNQGRTQIQMRNLVLTKKVHKIILILEVILNQNLNLNKDKIEIKDQLIRKNKLKPKQKKKLNNQLLRIKQKL